MFGILGFLWVVVWLTVYREVRGPTEEEFIQPPKVKITELSHEYKMNDLFKI